MLSDLASSETLLGFLGLWAGVVFVGGFVVLAGTVVVAALGRWLLDIWRRARL